MRNAVAPFPGNYFTKTRAALKIKCKVIAQVSTNPLSLLEIVPAINSQASQYLIPPRNRIIAGANYFAFARKHNLVEIQHAVNRFHFMSLPDSSLSSPTSLAQLSSASGHTQQSKIYFFGKTDRGSHHMFATHSPVLLICHGANFLHDEHLYGHGPSSDDFLKRMTISSSPKLSIFCQQFSGSIS